MKSERINVDLAKITRSAKPKKRERQHLVDLSGHSRYFTILVIHILPIVLVRVPLTF